MWRSEIVKLKPERAGNLKREHINIKFEIERSGRTESIRESCFTDDKPHLKALFQTESKLKLRLRRRIHTRESPLHYTSSSICNAMQQSSDERRRQLKLILAQKTTSFRNLRSFADIHISTYEAEGTNA